ncbi:hypothetical protein JCM3774_004015 [Rhodotorula dairenensis]
MSSTSSPEPACDGLSRARTAPQSGKTKRQRIEAGHEALGTGSHSADHSRKTDPETTESKHPAVPRSSTTLFPTILADHADNSEGSRADSEEEMEILNEALKSQAKKVVFTVHDLQSKHEKFLKKAAKAVKSGRRITRASTRQDILKIHGVGEKTADMIEDFLRSLPAERV